MCLGLSLCPKDNLCVSVLCECACPKKQNIIDRHKKDGMIGRAFALHTRLLSSTAHGCEQKS